MTDCDVVIVGSGPGGATVAEVLTAAGLVGDHPGEGPQPPARPGAAARAAAPLRQRRDRPAPPPPARPRPAARAAHLPPLARRRRSPAHRRREQPARRPSAAAACTPTPSSRASARRTSGSCSERGPVDGARIEDWPLGYDDLEPHYAAVERSFGVAGEDGANPFAAWRSSPFPMPPGDDMPMAVVSSAAAERAGLHPYRAPTGVNSVVYDGRPACVDCGFCGGYGCPIHAKGDPIAALQRALRTGRCELRPDALVTELVLDAERSPGHRRALPRPHRATRTRRSSRCARRGPSCWRPAPSRRRGCCCATASAATHVGRYLTYHFQTFTVGIFPEPTGGERGRSVTHLHDDLMIDTPELRAAAREAGLPWLRGGVVEHGAGPGPDRRGQHLPAGRAAPPLDAGQRAAPAAVGVHHAGRGPPAGDQPHRPRPVGARRVGPARPVG